MGKFQIFQDKSGEYRWRLRASNGQIIATSGEGYVAKADAQKGIESVKKLTPAASVEDTCCGGACAA